jgi:hypothetical protein
MTRIGTLALAALLPLGCTQNATHPPTSSGVPLPTQSAQPSANDGPAYAPDGSLILPPEYRAWIYLSTGLDMSYSERPAPAGQSVFDNVFVNPSSYQSFLATGTWPDKTTFILENRVAASKGSINVSGQYQTQTLAGIEAHVKDARFPGQWAFFHFDNAGKGALIPRPADCYTCHEQHGAVDTTFVQFYPTLIPIAQQHGTYHPAE